MPDHDPRDPRDLEWIAWRIAEIGRWRKDVDRMLSLHDTELNKLVNAQEIAAGVARELQKRGVSSEGLASELERRGVSPAVSLTWWQKLGGAVVGALVVIDALRGLIS